MILFSTTVYTIVVCGSIWQIANTDVNKNLQMSIQIGSLTRNVKREPFHSLFKHEISLCSLQNSREIQGWQNFQNDFCHQLNFSFGLGVWSRGLVLGFGLHTGLKAGFLRETSHAKKLKCASQFKFAHWDICILIIFDINASIPQTAYKIGALSYE